MIANKTTIVFIKAHKCLAFTAVYISKAFAVCILTPLSSSIPNWPMTNTIKSFSISYS